MKTHVIKLSEGPRSRIQAAKIEAKRARAAHLVATRDIDNETMNAALHSGLSASAIKSAKLSEDGEYVVATCYEAGEQAAKKIKVA